MIINLTFINFETVKMIIKFIICKDKINPMIRYLTLLFLIHKIFSYFHCLIFKALSTKTSFNPK